ncbi:BppU family phage baseplate upper protein [Enterococcus faecium]|uniref:BppU family phage baseplate upper protein n=1 Tax=Enterococcus faecium TaxID=1352 RepID=UPI001DDC1C00|nr:BppU family phage baseplate upper protein [Enterococcus faecium]MDG4641803.1 BppU family phage baseplate upper protein [Enterococcus faecium]MDG4644397.1 BppU family phage baseplate upper protein [Enterococcus faecium]NTR24547.1 BppU family phage baseplate upper protein [Enterococcus faecium]NTR43596.1 BppU family phage baseplate upper protein [Enterococcus faecium]HAQ0823105.1 BppU family phage baseplate upper protein [Enterococcus faecium]
MVYKMNESIIVIQAEATSPNRTNVVFWSHDRGTAKLRMKLVRKNGIPQSLPEGTTVPIRLMFKSATAEGGYGKHDYLATIEDPVNGIVSIVLEDNILGYVGTVEGSVYIDFPNDRSLDTAGRFTFYIKRSPIDDSTPELEDYYFNGFSQTIDKIEKILADGKQEIDQKIAESETQIDGKLKETNDKITKANQDVATLNTNIDKANARIDQTNQQISDLGKLKKMYSNSINFGNYDYSGNPNLMRVIKASDFKSQNGSDVLISDVGYNSIRLTSQGVNNIWTYSNSIPSLVSGKTYTISAKVKIEEGTTGNIGSLKVSYRKIKGGTILLAAISDELVVSKEIIIKGTGVVNYKINDLSTFYLDIGCAGVINGSVIVSDVKIEEGSTATPYQPNLLDDPYWLGKVPLGENIADPTKTFPIKSSGSVLYQGNMTEPFVVGETYTITVKGTKPSTQLFGVFNPGISGYGNLSPVEGLTDVWSLTFTPNEVSTDPKILQIVQTPNASVGACQIDWLKIEKGNTRTPNISQFKYFGEGLKDSNNPNDYSWDVTPEYTEKGLNDSVSLTEPQSVEGLKNFEDGLQIAGKEVATVPEDTGWVNLTAINGHSWNKQGQIRRIGKLVMFRGSLKGSTLSTQDFCTIPEGFRPSNPTDNYEYQFLLPPQSSNTLDNGGMAYIRPNGVCGLPSFRGTVNLFLAPIQYYIDWE